MHLLRQLDRTFREVVVIAGPILSATCLLFFVATSGDMRIDGINHAPTNYGWLAFGIALSAGMIGAWFCAMAIKGMPETLDGRSVLLRVPVYVFVLALAAGVIVWIAPRW